MLNLVEFHSASPLFSHTAFPAHIRISLYVSWREEKILPPAPRSAKYDPSQLYRCSTTTIRSMRRIDDFGLLFDKSSPLATGFRYTHHWKHPLASELTVADVFHTKREFKFVSPASHEMIVDVTKKKKTSVRLNRITRENYALEKAILYLLDEKVE